MNASLLRLGDIRVADLRCHEQIEWHCEPGVNLLTGDNGSGKTTLLEAVFMMGHGRSFRQARDPYLSRHDSDGFRIRGGWIRYGPVRVGVEGSKSGVKISLQGRQLQSRSDLTETLPVLVESPQAARLMDGIPAERRRWIDQVMLYCHPEVLRHYQAYLRCMMQRGRLLRRRAGSAGIEVWEEQMAMHGSVIVRVRDALIRELNHELGEEQALSEARLVLKMGSSAPVGPAEWAARLREQRRMGQSILRIGPHCDRLQVIYDRRDIRAVGSRGQQKLSAVALRLAECRLRMQHRGLIPVLLLDDCFEALDPARRDRLIERLLAHPGQVLMTGPSGTEGERHKSVHSATVQSLRENRSGKQAGGTRGMEEAA